MESKKHYWALIILLIATVGISHGQKVAVKTNLLYDATTTLNLGFEFGLGQKTTLDLSGNYNPWKFGNYRLKHWLIQPEFRYWFCERFNGHFIGFHGHYAKYNVGGLFFNDNMKHNRYQGHLYGGGISYGYQWVLNNRWNLEATIGVGYARLSDSKYPIASCGEKIKSENRNYWGPTKAGITIVYIIK